MCADLSKSGGKYLILGEIATSGCWPVHAAYDPDVDRRVALRIVTLESLDTAERKRLLSEALGEWKILANLSHPNVIGIHDAGEHGESLFMVTELVCGRTLDDWLHERRRSWREIVAIMIETGRGLAAAHAAGAVHGHLSAASIIVDGSGHARVAELGWSWLPARWAQRDRPATTRASIGSWPVEQRAPDAPELREGHRPDERSDQYGFCAIFAGALSCMANPTADERASSPIEKKIRGSKEGGAPTRVCRVLRRGLAEAPAERYSSLEALVSDLERARTFRLRMALLGLGLLAALAGLVVSGVWKSERAARCQGFEQALRETWGPTHRQRLQAVIQTAGKPRGDAAFREIAERLDEFGHTWILERKDACQGLPHPNDARSASDARGACLDWQAEIVGAFVEVLLDGDPDVIRRGADIVDRLDRMDRCHGAHASRRFPKLPEHPGPRLATRRALRHIARSRVFAYAGNGRRSEGEASIALDEARLAGARDIEAEAWRLKGYALIQLGETQRGESALWAAIESARYSGHDEVEAEAWADLVWLYAAASGRTQERVALAERYGQMALSVVGRLGGDDFLEGKILHTLSMVAFARGEFRVALDRASRALTLLAASRAGRLQLPAMRQLYALILKELGRLSEGSMVQQQAMSEFIAAMGADNPRVARYLVERAAFLEALGRHDEALDVVSQTLAMTGPEHATLPDVATQALVTAGQSLLALGRSEEAESRLQKARRIEKARLGPDDARISEIEMLLGTALRYRGRAREASTLQQGACGRLERTMGAGHAITARCLHELGRTLHASGDARGAVRVLERALQALELAGVGDGEVARTRHALAEALWASGLDPSRARALAAKALEEYGRAEGDHRASVTALRGWLATTGK